MQARRIPIFLIPVLCVLAIAANAAAQTATTQTFTTSQSEFEPGVRNQGWWEPVFVNRDSNDNYAVENGKHNFFTFDLSSACRATSVTLQLTRFDQVGTAEFTLWDVSTPAAVLNENEGASPAIYEDLGGGISFGTFVVEPGAPTDVLSFPLNAAGVAAFNAARGGFFSIGGSAVTPFLGFVFGFSQDGGSQQLLATCVPEMPTSAQQCKHDGWRSFGVFKSQGDCVSFVATSGRNLPG